MAEVYPQLTLLAALALARQYNTYSHRFIRGFLEAGGKAQQGPTPLLPFRAPPVRVTADLGVYQRLLEAGR